MRDADEVSAAPSAGCVVRVSGCGRRDDSDLAWGGRIMAWQCAPAHGTVEECHDQHAAIKEHFRDCCPNFAHLWQQAADS